MTLTVSFARMVQFLSAAVLFGAPLFFVYATPLSGAWRRTLLAGAIIAMALGILAAAGMQAAELSGASGLPAPQDISWYFLDTRIGNIAIVRLLILAGCGFAIWRLPLGAPCFAVLAALGALILASFAWTGHGAEDGAVRTAAYVVHLLMAGVWAGALAALLGGILASRAGYLPPEAVAHGLAAFSRVGVAVVGLLVASGIANAILTFGIPSWSSLRSAYGITLMAKLVLFECMIALAALNRYRFSPGLDAALLTTQSARPQLRALCWSLVLETTLAIAVIGLAAHLGSLEPPGP